VSAKGDQADRCPNCGRFVEDEADGFYAKLDPLDDMAPVVPFCDEPCVDAYRVKNPPRCSKAGRHDAIPEGYVCDECEFDPHR